MDGLFPDRRIWGEACPRFGPSRYTSSDPPCEALDVPRRRHPARLLVRARVPRAPGVYGMIDETGDLMYVGMSGRLRHRLLTYFTGKRRGTKERRIAGRAVRLVWEVHAHELIAQVRELELIRLWRPRLNARGRPSRHEPGYLYLTGGAAPTLRAGRRVPASFLQCWGPLPLTHSVQAAVGQLNRLFHLRDCPDRTPMRYAEQRELWPISAAPACLRRELGSCLAPCSGVCRQSDYAQSVAAARAVLDGNCGDLIESYESAMRTAAAQQDFEQAAQSRDIGQHLVLLRDYLTLVRRAQRELWGVYAIRDVTARPAWILIAGGRVSAVTAAPRSIAGARRCLELLDETFDQRCPAPADDYDHIRLVAAWFRRHPDEQKRIRSPDEARSLCRRKATRRDARVG